MLVPDQELADHAIALCQQLIRIDTSNPPGNERPAADLVAGELAAAGLEPQVLESAPGRANVVARLSGSGSGAPLLLATHLDVVEAHAEHWRHPPFSGAIVDDWLWGRGAIDMKNMVAMCVALLVRMAREKLPLARDVIFAAVADEECGCQHGSAWLCAEHPELVRAQYALGEGGGFNIFLGAKRFVTIEVAEKGVCWVRARVRGEPGHGMMPRPDSAPLKLAAALLRLGRRGLPTHRTPVMSEFLDAIARAQAPALRPLLAGLAATGALRRLVSLIPDPSVARGLAAMMANTATPTVLRAGAPSQTNVIPALAEAEIDGRTLPGQREEDFLRELGHVLGPEVELEVLRSAPPVETQPIRSDLYDTIVEVLSEHQPDAAPVPYLAPGYTDAKSFTRLGAQWYGFAPVRLPRGVRYADLFHGQDERVPLDGLRWGSHVLADVVTRFACSA